MLFVLRFVLLKSVTSGMLQKSGPAVFKEKKKLKIKHTGIKQSYVGKSFLQIAVTPLCAGQQLAIAGEVVNRSHNHGDFQVKSCEKKKNLCVHLLSIGFLRFYWLLNK